MPHGRTELKPKAPNASATAPKCRIPSIAALTVKPAIEFPRPEIQRRSGPLVVALSPARMPTQLPPERYRIVSRHWTSRSIS